MKILIICSKAFYDKIADIKQVLEKAGHKIELPNCYDNPGIEAIVRGTSEHSKFKAEMFKKSEQTISNMDAVLVLNFTKNGKENYIGGATFLEMYDAFRLNKKIYMLHNIPEGMLKDEIIGFNPTIINEDLKLIKGV